MGYGAETGVLAMMGLGIDYWGLVSCALVFLAFWSLLSILLYKFLTGK
jgi:hypothetical protein